MRASFVTLPILALTLFLGGTQAWALEEIIKSYRGIRSLGMGGVVTTTGQYDESLYGNPATQLEDPNWKLSILSLTAEINGNIVSDYRKLSTATSASGSDALSNIANSGILGRNEHDRITIMAPGFYSPHFFGDDTSFAIAMLVNEQSNIMLRSNASVDAQAFLDAGPSAGVGHKFLDGALDTGINAHLQYRLSAQKSILATDFLAGKKIALSSIGGQGVGLDFDLGALYKLPFDVPFFKKLYAGASANNILASDYTIWKSKFMKNITDTPTHDNRSFNLGGRADLPDLLILTNTTLAAELQDLGSQNVEASFWKRTHFGAETHLIGFLAVRAGINEGYFGGGLGLDLPLLKLDLATYGEEMGSNTGQLEDRRYAMRVAFEI